jgi:hypothetical protein
MSSRGFRIPKVWFLVTAGGVCLLAGVTWYWMDRYYDTLTERAVGTVTKVGRMRRGNVPTAQITFKAPQGEFTLKSSGRAYEIGDEVEVWYPASAPEFGAVGARSNSDRWDLPVVILVIGLLLVGLAYALMHAGRRSSRDEQSAEELLALGGETSRARKRKKAKKPVAQGERLCPHCRTSISDDAEACPHCGTFLA